MTPVKLAIGVVVSIVWINPILAETNDVALPENYASRFVRYTSVDKPAGDSPAKMRYFYVNPESLASAKPGQPMPDGTVLIMEDHKVKLQADGKPIADGSGRFIPTEEITNIFVQEKQAGWGKDRSAETRNGEWEYAWFNADGARRTDKTMDACFACHLKASGEDFTFTFAKFLKSIK